MKDVLSLSARGMGGFKTRPTRGSIIFHAKGQTVRDSLMAKALWGKQGKVSGLSKKERNFSIFRQK
jgi:hypothetical protein